MNVREARVILGIDENASKEEAKKAFRNLAKKCHPDINKEPGAEEEFKRIGEAFQVVETGIPSTREEQQQANPFGAAGAWGFSIEDLFNNLSGSSPRAPRVKIQAQDISLKETLTFKESVLGCNKTITYSRNSRCTPCSGAGQKTLDNGCDVCRGSGRIRTQQGNTIMERGCHKCHGKLNYAKCEECNGKGFVKAEATISVNLPAGVIEGSALNLGPRGNYAGDAFGGEQNTALLLHLHVLPQEGLSIKEADVLFDLNISLLEAFKGCEKTVPTIDGDKEIQLPKLIKNKEEVILPNLGVSRRGKQIVIVNVSYPEKVESLMELLEKE